MDLRVCPFEQENLATARTYLEGRGRFPERAALNQLVGRFLTDFYVTVARWTEWASQVVESWPDDIKEAPFDVTAQEKGVELAESIAAVLDPLRASTRDGATSYR